MVRNRKQINISYGTSTINWRLLFCLTSYFFGFGFVFVCFFVFCFCFILSFNRFRLGIYFIAFLYAVIRFLVFGKMVMFILMKLLNGFQKKFFFRFLYGKLRWRVQVLAMKKYQKHKSSTCLLETRPVRTEPCPSVWYYVCGTQRFLFNCGCIWRAEGKGLLTQAKN